MQGRFCTFMYAATAVACMAATGAHAASNSAQIARGKYLVTIAGCSDCHTPGVFLGHPDMSKYLGGSDVAFVIPGLGAFAGRNLSPDKETGLGNWTTAQIITAFTKGVEPGGRKLAPVMPYEAFAHLTHGDAVAIALFLKSIKPVRHAVAGPFGASEKPTMDVYEVLPPDVYNSMPKPPAPH